MRSALAVLVLSFVIIADFAYQGADRLHAAIPHRGSIESALLDWETGTYLAVMVGFAGVVWVAAAVTSNKRLNWFSGPFARYGAGGAIIGGFGAALFTCVRALADGEGLHVRYEWEGAWLVGAVLGGLVGSVVGGGIGIATHGRARSSPAPIAANAEPDRAGN